MFSIKIFASSKSYSVSMSIASIGLTSKKNGFFEITYLFLIMESIEDTNNAPVM